MKVAIIGAGISGLTCAHVMQGQHDVTLFEAAPRAGGHACTINVQHEGQSIDVDMGFIVFNDRTYPNFELLLRRLGVPWRDTGMSFSVSCDRSGVEYGGGSLAGLFAQSRNLVRLSHWRMLKDIVRFNRKAPEVLLPDSTWPDGTLLTDYLQAERYSAAFVERYLIPMGGAIWSSPREQMNAMPLKFFVRFFENHGILTLKGRPQWRTIVGGSHQYVSTIADQLGERLRLHCPVCTIRRHAEGVDIKMTGGAVERFDAVILALHSDQALRLLENPSQQEQATLAAIRYQPNEAVLHWDQSLLPRRRGAWACWNYYRPRNEAGRVAVTYNMNLLQGFRTRDHLCVTLNRSAQIDPQKIFQQRTFDHPVFDQATIAAQREWQRISGQQNTYYCGAYWRNGFHEDGVWSALRVCQQFGVDLDDFPFAGRSLAA